jgi:predicted TIM-barrel enzyme
LLPPLDDDRVWTALVSDVSEDSEEETARFSAAGVTAVVLRTLNA